MQNKKTRRRIHQHARKRANQRFGIFIDKWKMKGLNSLIRNASNHPDSVRVIGKQSHSRTRFDLLIDGKWIPVVYDTKRHGIVTFLPEEALGIL